MIWTFDDPPGVSPFDDVLRKRLSTAWESRAAEYVPRTKHVRPDGLPKYINRLFLESSPYLRQHAHNPLNWFPWGDEAFELARSLGRPVLLSIGYSTCHWCHVMEEESFDDEEIARYLNEEYIAIKVDREVRPDLDAIYMSAVQLFLQGRGGWPMTLWLTPDREPYSGGTYFPAHDGDRGISVGFLTMLKRMKEAYDEQPTRIAEVSAQVAERVRTMLTPEISGESLPTMAALQAATIYYREHFDQVHGGLRSQIKFPSSLPIRFLLRHYKRTGDEQSLDMATRTLERMAAGGIHDQVGGGFHRYSTDSAWLVPHFEKMLYDNALLVSSFLEAYQVTGREDFAQVVRTTLRYVDRDMTSPEGAFYSATDADSLGPSGEREEGWFFTWTPDEFAAALGGREKSAMARAFYGVTDSGNFEGRTILSTPRLISDVAVEMGVSTDEFRQTIDEARNQLYQVRAKRPQPLRDEKILTGWNGLMISAFARAALIMNEPSYSACAAKAADYVLTQLRNGGRLLRTALNGKAQQPAYLSDYAFLIAGLLDLYEATGELRWLKEAKELDAVLENNYEDTVEGAFFRTADDHESLITREKPSFDNAEPSGNSVHLLNLLRLSEFTSDDRYRQRAQEGFKVFSNVLTKSPAAVSEMLLALDFNLDNPREIIIVVPKTKEEAKPFLDVLRSRFLPNRILVVTTEGAELDRQTTLVPLLKDKVARDNKATAYVCENRICALPTTEPAMFETQISGTYRLNR